MQFSSLQLERYLVHSLSFSIDERYDADKPSQHSAKSLDVTANFHDIENPQDEPSGQQIQAVVLTIDHKAPEGINAPYLFNIRLVGYFSWLPEAKLDNREKIFRVNAPSILYGIAREIIHAETARGPFPAINLPSLSFLHLAESEPSAEIGTPKKQLD